MPRKSEDTSCICVTYDETWVRDFGRVKYVGIRKEIYTILSNWPISVLQVRQYKDVFRVKAREGEYCLKEIEGKKRRVLAIGGVLEHLVNRDFTKTALPHRDRDGRLLTESGGRYYVLTDWLDGRKPNFARREDDIRLAAGTLALFHQAAAGYVAPPGTKLKSRLGRWPRRYRSRLRKLVSLREILNHKPYLDRFDRIFLEHYDWMLEKALDALHVLESSAYDRLGEEARRKNSICHADVAERNFVISSTGECSIIDLDLVRYDVRVADIYKLFRDAMKKCRWDFAKAQLILRSYSEVSPLRQEELPVLFAMFEYPHKMLHCVLRYYEKRLIKDYGWSTRKFVEKMEEEGRNRPAIDRFLRVFRQECGIS